MLGLHVPERRLRRGLRAYFGLVSGAGLQCQCGRLMLSLSGSARQFVAPMPAREFWRGVETRGRLSYLLGKQRPNETIAPGDSQSRRCNSSR